MLLGIGRSNAKFIWSSRRKGHAISSRAERSLEMSVSAFVRSWLTPPIVVGLALQGSSVQGQQRGGTPQTENVQPVNSGVNPYRVIRDWAQLNLEARPWGGSN